MEIISNEVKPPHRLRRQAGHDICKDHTFHIPKKVIPVEREIIEERVLHGLIEPAWGSYRYPHFLVPKKHGKYTFIISAVSANWHTQEDTGIPLKVEECSEVLAELPMTSLNEFPCG